MGSFADNMRILSNINCTLASMNSYMEQRSNGVSAQQAQFNFFGNMANGIARNEIAYGMQRHGNPIGNNVNLYAGYGSNEANQIGTMGLLSANCSPWMFFGCQRYMTPMMPTYNYYQHSFGTLGMMSSGCSPWMFFNCCSCMPYMTPPPMSNFCASFGMGNALGRGLGGFLC